MAFAHGLSTKFYYNLLDMTPYIEDVGADFEREMADVKPMDSTWVERLAGHKSVTISVGGLYDPTAGGIDAQVWDAFDDGEEHVFAMCPYGDTIGYYCYCGESVGNSSSINSSSTDAIRYPVGAIGSDNADRCQILHVLSEESDDGTDTSQDGTAQSSDGIHAYIICTAIESGATLDVTIQDSSNNSDWSTLGSFTQLTAAGDEVISVSGTVERYVRLSWDLSEGASDDATFFVAFRRL